MKKCNNAGFSLVELIVTILIISILATGVVASVVAMHRADSDKEANKIAMILAKGRQQALSKADGVYVKLYANVSGQYISIMQGNTEISTEELDDKAVIVYKLSGSLETEKALTIGGVENGVNIYFSKSSGAFKTPFVEYIKVTADKDLYVCLVEDTGRCYIDTRYIWE